MFAMAGAASSMFGMEDTADTGSHKGGAGSILDAQGSVDEQKPRHRGNERDHSSKSPGAPSVSPAAALSATSFRDVLSVVARVISIYEVRMALSLLIVLDDAYGGLKLVGMGQDDFKTLLEEVSIAEAHGGKLPHAVKTVVQDAKKQTPDKLGSDDMVGTALRVFAGARGGDQRERAGKLQRGGTSGVGRDSSHRGSLVSMASRKERRGRDSNVSRISVSSHFAGKHHSTPFEPKKQRKKLVRSHTTKSMGPKRAQSSAKEEEDEDQKTGWQGQRRALKNEGDLLGHEQERPDNNRKPRRASTVVGIDGENKREKLQGPDQDGGVDEVVEIVESKQELIAKYRASVVGASLSLPSVEDKQQSTAQVSKTDTGGHRTHSQAGGDQDVACAEGDQSSNSVRFRTSCGGEARADGHAPPSSGSIRLSPAASPSPSIDPSLKQHLLSGNWTDLSPGDDEMDMIVYKKLKHREAKMSYMADHRSIAVAADNMHLESVSARPGGKAADGYLVTEHQSPPLAITSGRQSGQHSWDIETAAKKSSLTSDDSGAQFPSFINGVKKTLSTKSAARASGEPSLMQKTLSTKSAARASGEPSLMQRVSSTRSVPATRGSSKIPSAASSFAPSSCASTTPGKHFSYFQGISERLRGTLDRTLGTDFSGRGDDNNGWRAKDRSSPRQTEALDGTDGNLHDPPAPPDRQISPRTQRFSGPGRFTSEADSEMHEDAGNSAESPDGSLASSGDDDELASAYDSEEDSDDSNDHSDDGDEEDSEADSIFSEDDLLGEFGPAQSDAVTGKRNKFAKQMLEQAQGRGGFSSRLDLSHIGMSTPSHSFIIHPMSRWRMFWDILNMVFIMTELVLLPVSVGFDVEMPLPIDITTTAFFAVDMLMSCITGFFRGGHLVMHLRPIINHYLRTRFLIDISATLPWDLVVRSEGNIGLLPRFMRVACRWARLLRVADLIARLEEVIQSYYTVLVISLMKTMTSFALLCHWMACVWAFIGSPNIWVRTQYFYEEPHPLTDCTQGGSCELAMEGSPWRRRYGVENMDFSVQYLMSLAFSFGLMTGQDVNLQPGYWLERIYVTSMFSLSFLVCTWMVSNIILMLSKINQRKSDFREQMLLVKDFMVKRHVPLKLQGKVRSYLEYKYKAQQENDRGGDFVNKLSPWLRLEMKDHLYKSLIVLHPFFKQLPDMMLKRVCGAASTAFYAPGDVIMQKGHMATCMCFLVHGRVRVLKGLQVKQESGETITRSAILQPPSWIGDMCLFTNMTRARTVLSMSHSELLCITKDSIGQLALEFPKMLTYYKSFKAQVNDANGTHCQYCHQPGHFVGDCPLLKSRLHGGPEKPMLPGAQTDTDLGREDKKASVLATGLTRFRQSHIVRLLHFNKNPHDNAHCMRTSALDERAPDSHGKRLGFFAKKATKDMDGRSSLSAQKTRTLSKISKASIKSKGTDDGVLKRQVTFSSAATHDNVRRESEETKENQKVLMDLIDSSHSLMDIQESTQEDHSPKLKVSQRLDEELEKTEEKRSSSQRLSPGEEKRISAQRMSPSQSLPGCLTESLEQGRRTSDNGRRAAVSVLSSTEPMVASLSLTQPEPGRTSAVSRTLSAEQPTHRRPAVSGKASDNLLTDLTASMTAGVMPHHSDGGRRISAEGRRGAVSAVLPEEVSTSIMPPQQTPPLMPQA